MWENRTLGNRWRRKEPMYPEGNIVPAPRAETDSARGTSKGPNLAPASATVKGSAETQMGEPPHGRRKARRATTSMPLGPEGGIRHFSELARTARREEALEGSRTPADGPRANYR